MHDPVELLLKLGFSEYEARAYVGLLQRSPLTGYELARQTQLPRPNIYSVLEKLEARGAVVRVEAPEGVRYAAVPSDELLHHMDARLQASLAAARRSLREVAAPAEPDYVWNARGHEALLDHARALIDGAQSQLLLAVWPPEAHTLAPDMAAAEARGIEVITLCLAACTHECGGCRGRLYRYQVAPSQASRWLVIVADRMELLAGQIDPDGQAQVVRTRQQVLVNLGEWYIRHNIALATVLTDLGGRLDDLITPDTRAVLDAVGPGGPGGGWLEHMRHLLSRVMPPAP